MHLSDIPTIRESGYPDYTQYSWVSFYVHADTPADITDKLAAAMQTVLSSEEAKAYVATTGGELMAYEPARMQAFQASEQERFRRIAQAAGIQPQ